MRKAGVNISTWGLGGAAAHCNDIGWKGMENGQSNFDFSRLDRIAEFILQEHPDAWLIPSVAVTAPRWWLEANPDDNAIMSTGLATGPGNGVGAVWSDEPRETVVSQASDRWQQGMEMALAKMIAHIDTSSWGHRCIGLQPNGGVNEWFVSHSESWSDYSPLALAAFRSWLKKQGIADADTWEIPRPEELKEGSFGNWIDPSIAADKPKEMWWRFFHELNATRMFQSCEAVKTASHNRLITGAFYGYIGDSYGNGKPAAWLYGHHFDLRTVTEHPTVD